MTAPATTACQIRRRGNLDVLAWPVFDRLAVDVAVTTRHGGVSSGHYASLNLGLHVADEDQAVIENRRRAAAAFGATLDDLVFCDQAHGRSVRVVTAADRGRGAHALADAIGATDALVTGEPGIVLAVMVADCVPVVLYDPAAHVLACVHAGWRGTVARVGEAAVAAMAALGSRPRDIIAGIGPAISPAAYQVGGDVISEVERAFGAAAREVLRPDGDGHAVCDLWTANRLTLRDAGVPDAQIHTAAVPTGPDPGRFYSHRAEAPCGRFALLARLAPRGDL